MVFANDTLSSSESAIYFSPHGYKVSLKRSFHWCHYLVDTQQLPAAKG